MPSVIDTREKELLAGIPKGTNISSSAMGESVRYFVSFGSRYQKKFGVTTRCVPHLRGAGFALCLLVGIQQDAFCSEVKASVGVDIVSEYIEKNETEADAVIQPGIVFTKGAFNFGAWTSFAVGDNKDAFSNPVEIYAGYGFDVSDAIEVGLEAKIVHDTDAGSFFDIGLERASALELSASLAFDTALSPTLTVDYDVFEGQLSVEVGGNYIWNVARYLNFELGFDFGLTNISDASSHHYAVVSGNLYYGIKDKISVYFGVNTGVSSEDTFLGFYNEPTGVLSFGGSKTNVWAGGGVSKTF